MTVVSCVHGKLSFTHFSCNAYLMTALPLAVCRTESAEAAVNRLAMVSLLHERGSFCMYVRKDAIR
jgi:hypothetical protein